MDGGNAVLVKCVSIRESDGLDIVLDIAAPGVNLRSKGSEIGDGFGQNAEGDAGIVASERQLHSSILDQRREEDLRLQRCCG